MGLFHYFPSLYKKLININEGECTSKVFECQRGEKVESDIYG